MQHHTIPLWTKEEYQYQTGTDFVPSLTAYLQEGANPRPGVLVVPGGGYRMLSPLEGEPVAMRFLEQGYHAFMLTYTTRPQPEMPPLGLQPLRDISRAMVLLRQNAGRWRLQAQKIAAVGFSAGGHLVASLSALWAHPALQDIPGLAQHSNRLDAAMLIYPVISGSPALHHSGSFENLLGEGYGQQAAQELSLDLHVGAGTPPTFLMHTAEDATVPVGNSLVYATALQAAGVPFELHVYPYMPHGNCTFDEPWARHMPDYAASPCFALQRALAAKELAANGKPSGEEAVAALLAQQYPYAGERPLGPWAAHNAGWLKLALEWLRLTFAEG